MPPADTRSTIELLREAASAVSPEWNRRAYAARASHLEALLAGAERDCKERGSPGDYGVKHGLSLANDPPASPPEATVKEG